MPSETTSAEEDPPVQVSPDVGSILAAFTGSATVKNIVSGLGVAVTPLFKPRPRVLHKAFMASHTNTFPKEFGWYRRAAEDASQEGVHYAAAVLQVNREKVKALDVAMTMTSDWVKGNVDNQEAKLNGKIELSYPTVPKTPSLALARSARELPIVLEKAQVRDILGIDENELAVLIKNSGLVAFGADKQRISKGSLLKILGIPNE